MSVREYVGARYVPLFAEPLAWDATRTYEPLTVVLYQGNSFTSRQAVPANIPITNTTYWAQTGNYNAQVEQYRAEVQTFDGRITANTTAITAEETARATAVNNEATARAAADTSLASDINSLNALIPAANFSSVNTVKKYVDDNIQIVQDEIDTINEQKYMVVIGDSFSNSSQSGTPLWYTYVANYYGLTAYTNATAGVGFVEGSNNFMAQLNTAITAMAGKTVERVYILGGLNDTRSGSFDIDTVKTAANNLFIAIRNEWPNAKVAMYGPQSFPEININNAPLAFWLAYFSTVNKIEYHDITAVFNLYNNFFGGQTGTNPHPSAQGQKQIAQYIISHGDVPYITWQPSFVKTSITPYTPTVGSVSVASGSGTIGSNVIKNQKLFRTGDRYVYGMVLNATEIPDTVGTIAIAAPYNIAALLDQTTADNRNYSDCYLSQLLSNNVHSGWLSGSTSRRFNFNINGSTGITTGSGARDIRVTMNIYRN